MEKSLLRLAKAFAILCLFSTAVFAQDTWTPSEINGFGNTQNYRIKCMHVFKGNLYAGAGDDTGILYKSASGNFGSWGAAFTDSLVIAIDNITSTNDGGGYMYVSTYSSENDNPKIYKSADGINWSLYYKSIDRVQNMIAYKGLGTEDSLYVMSQNYFGETRVDRSYYNSNDPSDTLAAWDSVFQFSSGTTVTGSYVFNNKLYLTTNYGNLWTKSIGGTFMQNTVVGTSFGDQMTNGFSAIGSYNGYLYIGTDTYATGAQIWRSNDDSTWVKVAEFPNYSKITSFEVANGQLWAAMAASSGGQEQIVKTADGLVYTTSDASGFGYQYNHGLYGNLTAFGNNLYYASENYGYPKSTGGSTNHGVGFGFSTGGQIWRMCFGVSPTISAGADQTICLGTNAAFTADAGFTDYAWDDGSTNQILITSVLGEHFVVATDANGCSAMDTVNLNSITSPSISVINPYMGYPAVLCKGDSIKLINQAFSNLRINLPAFSKVTADSIHDYTSFYDTINVSGVNDNISTALLSLTIDSLYHANDGDLLITIYAPDGSSADISKNAGYNSQNFIGTVLSDNAPTDLYYDYGPFTGNYRPYMPFSSYLTGSANGKWVLYISDLNGGNEGVLKGWSLNFSVPDTAMTYAWSPAAGLSSSTYLNPAAFPIVNTAYTLTVTNSIGCTASITDTIKVPSISITASLDSLCYGSSALLTSIGGINPAWSPASTLSSTSGTIVTATPTANTTYYVTDTVFGCAVSDSIKLFSNPAIIASAGTAQTICFTDTATIMATATGGTAPYTYLWNGGGNNYNTQAVQVSPSVSTTYSVSITDAFGCTQFSGTNVAVNPSTNIYGHAGYSSGNVTTSGVVLYKYEPFLTHFDTVAITTTDASGNFSFSSVNHAEYLIKVFPNASYTTLVPTYYGNSFLWADSLKLTHDCTSPDTLNIAIVEEIAGASGPGYLHGVIREGAGFGRAPGGPVPGIDVKLGRNPTGAGMVTNTQTDGNGEYSFSNVGFGSYIVYADIPGIGRDSSYVITVDSTQSVYNYLDYVVDSTMIRIVPDAGVGILNPSVKENNFTVYPNPSKGNATVEYTINADAHVSLGIYNVLGVKVSELVNEKQSAGTYSMSINEKNKNLGSGVYFIVLTSNEKTTIHKIIITQ